ncbi:MAG: Uma2 family endonuclease [Ginsengibacter sp.]
MNAVKILPHYTYEDYCLWEGRWELIEGIPYAMSPAPSPRHQWIVVNIVSELRSAIKKSNCKHCKVYDFIDMKIEEDTILQPDASIVCKPIQKKFLDFSPALVVEILSDATVLKDRHTKFSLYQDFGIKYYLIVDAEKETVEIYCLEKSKYELQKVDPEKQFTFSLSDDCRIDLTLKNIWE